MATVQASRLVIQRAWRMGLVIARRLPDATNIFDKVPVKIDCHLILRVYRASSPSSPPFRCCRGISLLKEYYHDRARDVYISPFICRRAQLAAMRCLCQFLEAAYRPRCRQH